MRRFWFGFCTFGLMACGEDKDAVTGDAVFDQVVDNEDNAQGSGCPTVVPEQYWFLWDCENTEGCNGKLYRYGEGESFADGTFEVTEQWFLFNGPGDYCVDTFIIRGQYDSREPSTYGCASCEEMYQVVWNIQESQCEVLWSPFFADQEASSAEGQEYYGYLIFDSHGGWQIRNEEVLITASPVNGNSYDPNFNYARGSTTPVYEGVAYTGQPADGDTLLLTATAGTSKTYEFDNDGSVADDNISVDISGDDADQTYGNLKTAIESTSGHGDIEVRHTDDNDDSGNVMLFGTAENSMTAIITNADPLPTPVAESDPVMEEQQPSLYTWANTGDCLQ